MQPDLVATRRALLGGGFTAAAALEAALAAASSEPCARAFLTLSAEGARRSASAADAAVAAGRDPGPLAGLAVSIKDLFDVVGEVTSAGSTVLASVPPATADAPAVARLRAAGAAFVGRTNMSEFAFSGVGINPHYGTPVNAATARLERSLRVPGGSTSGGATSVAASAAWAALGSDTGGSIRIPAALQGLVGFKSTARLVPTAGAVPLSTTLDTVAAITRSVRDAAVLHEILAGRQVTPGASSLASWRFAVSQTLLLDGLEPAVARAFDSALATLSAQGARIETIALPLLDEVAGLNAAGGFAAAESWAWHQRHVAESEAMYDPRVVMRIKRGAAISPADYAALVAARAAWIRRMEQALQPYDAVLSPTVPLVAPLLAPLLDDDAAFFATNGLLLRNPSLVNFLDGCALSLPCQAPGTLPVGLMVWAPALHDDAVLAAGLAIEAALRPADAPVPPAP